MKKMEMPELELVELKEEDVIATSDAGCKSHHCYAEACSENLCNSYDCWEYDKYPDLCFGVQCDMYM